MPDPSRNAPTTSRIDPDLPIHFSADIGAEARSEITELVRSWDRTLFGAAIDIRRLPGGANNTNYVLTTGDRRYALRIANQDNDRMAVDRVSARHAQRDAARIGAAPAVIAHCDNRGHLLSEFITGTALSVDTIGAADILTAIAHTLKALHATESTCHEFDPFADIDMWIGHAIELGKTIPAEVADLRRRAQAVHDCVSALNLPKPFCHSDTVPQNIMWDGTRATLVDWDYAGHCYAAFELGSLICTADLTPEQRTLFLHAYDPELDEPSLARITLMQFVAGLREIAWVLNADALSGTTMVDSTFYDDYLDNNLRRARTFGFSPDFDTRLRAAARRGTSASV